MGSMVGLLVTSKRTHANTCFPRPLLLVSLSPWQAPANPYLFRRPSNIHRQIWLSLLWDYCSFPLGFVCALQESLFSPVCGHSVIKSCCPSKSDSLGIPIPLLDPQVGKSMWGLETLQQWENFLVLLLSSLWVAHPVSTGFYFCVIAPLLPSCCGFSFVFGLGVSLLVGSSLVLLMVVQQLVVILVLFQEEVSAHPFCYLDLIAMSTNQMVD